MKDIKIIKFKNGSSIVSIEGEPNKGSKRIYTKLQNSDGTVDYIIEQEMLNEILIKYCRNINDI